MIHRLLAGAMLFSSLVVTSCKKEQAKFASRINSIKLVSATPTAGSRINRNTTLNSRVDYTLADDEQSAYGYIVFVQLKMGSGSTGPAMNSSGNVTVTDRVGSVDLSVLLADDWQRIDHPVTCYLTLGRKTSAYNAVKLERVELTFTE